LVGLRFVLLTLALPFLGLWMTRARVLPWTARIPVYFATGLFTIVAEMFLISALGGHWSAWALLPLPLLLIAAGRFLSARPAGEPVTRPGLSVALALVAIAILTSMILAAAATSGDYVFFWGVKGQRFGQQRVLDTAFTLDPSHYMHPDYPPMVPLYYAWTMLGGKGAFDWWGGMLSSALFLFMATAALWGFGRYARVRAIDEIAVFFASLYALFFMRNAVAGNAEPALIFFETVALAALTCWRERPGEHDVIASLALCGVAFTKVEGGVFVALVVGMTWIMRRSSWRMAIAPVATLFAWVAFGKLRGLTDTYVPRDDLSLQYILPTAIDLVRELSLHLWYVPWIVMTLLLVPRIGGARPRNAIPYIIASLGFVVFLLLIYTRKDPHLEWSAGRTLMTPTLLYLFGVIAALRAGVTGLTSGKAASV
jgi:hypothetical protein